MFRWQAKHGKKSLARSGVVWFFGKLHFLSYGLSSFFWEFSYFGALLMLLKTDLHTDTQFKNGILSYPFVILVLSVTSNNLPVTGQRHVVGDELGWLPPKFGLQKTRDFEADSAAKEAGRAQRSLPSSTGGDEWKRWDVAFMALSKGEFHAISRSISRSIFPSCEFLASLFQIFILIYIPPKLQKIWEFWYVWW